MNILVTGGSGFIGSRVVDKLVDAGHKVTIFDSRPPNRSDISFVEGNITSKMDVRKALRKGFDVVYHIAAFSNIDLVKDNPITTIESNIVGTAYLLEESRQCGIKRFILASSVYVYGNRGHLYTTCKKSSELLCRNYYELYSLPYTLLRYGTAYGPGSRGADVISLFVKQAVAENKLVIHGSGRQRRNFIYVDDLAAGNVAALKEIARNKTYNLANRFSVSISELAAIVNKSFRNKLAIEYLSAREDDYKGRIIDYNKAEKELGWKPLVSLEDGVKAYIKWYKGTLVG